MPMSHKRLGAILLEKRLITPEQLRECLDEQKLTKEYLGAILLKKKIVGEGVLMKALSEQFGIPYLSLKDVYIDWNVCLRFASVVTSEEKALPIRQDESSVTVAISDPLNVFSIEKIEEIARPKHIKLVLVSGVELREYFLECKKRLRGSLKDLLEKE